MSEIVGVRFRRSGKIYHFDPAGAALKLGDSVVVETANGLELGRAVVFTTTESVAELSGPLKPVVRLATPEDIQRSVELCPKEKEALAETGRLVERLSLPMKLIQAEYNLDASHLTVYFSAEGRVDFRDLVRELSYALKVRVELRQAGPRDEAKLLGGFGRCGREHCCVSFLDDFSPVSIKMAKVQDLSLNPMKISGVCGRLLCCLGYECEQYRIIKEKMPREGRRVMTDAGPGVVVGLNTLEESVMVEYETGVRVEYPVAKIKVLEAPRPPGHRPQSVQPVPASQDNSPEEAPAPQPEPPRDASETSEGTTEELLSQD
ncbi:MAG: stage 0 sporulation family protein [Dehalococcoidia bacterium]|nr:stage 0 sporulation family protein [Dehalococcoidia bacterium]